MSKTRGFNAVAFVGGPLDGVCWPCLFDPDAMAVLSTEGRLHVYECDQETTDHDGFADYRMVPSTSPGDVMSNLNAAMAANAVRDGVEVAVVAQVEIDEAERELAALRSRVAELEGALRGLLAASPAFRGMPIGAPGSHARAKQEEHERAEDAARAVLAKSKETTRGT